MRSWRWLYIIAGIIGVAAAIGTFVWPDITLYVVSIMVAWYLRSHVHEPAAAARLLTIWSRGASCRPVEAG